MLICFLELNKKNLHIFYDIYLKSIVICNLSTVKLKTISQLPNSQESRETT